MGSNRLPGKILLPIRGKPVLWHVYNRISKSNLINKTIIATTTNHEDDEIEKFCKSQNIPLFRGNSDDVLDRYYQCAKEYGILNIIRITGDCPLIDYKIVDMAIKQYTNERCDYLSNFMELPYPDGFNCEVFSFEALKIAWEKAILPSEREHVTPFIKKNKAFNKFNLKNKLYPVYRLSLDYPADYKVITEIFNDIGKDLFSIKEVFEYLKEHPKILNLNKDIPIDDGYLKSLQKDENFLRGKTNEKFGKSEKSLFR